MVGHASACHPSEARTLFLLLRSLLLCASLCALCVSALNRIPHCLQLQKLNPFPSHHLPHSYFGLPPPLMLSLKSEGTPMTNPKKPLSDKQLAADRANAAQCTEDLDEVARLRQDLIAVYQPVNSQELFAIERIALAQQTLLRVERLHIGLCTTCRNEALDGNGRPLMGISPDLVNGDNEITKAQNRNYLFAEGFHRLNKYSNSFTLFLRYQAQSERLYRRAIEEFDRLKALRHELPNEPVMDTQPEVNETVNPPQLNPGNPSNPSAAGNLPGQPPRFRPNGEPFLVPTPPPATVPPGD
jgi:hypothetical protein